MKALIFDLDGTLVELRKVLAYQTGFAEAGMPVEALCRASEPVFHSNIGQRAVVE